MVESKVWVVSANAKSPSFYKAATFGKIMFLTEGYVEVQDDGFQTLMQKRVQDNVREEDYLLLSGNKLMNALAVLEALRKHGAIRVLHYDGRAEKYRVKVVSL